MIAVDTNILVYAYRPEAPRHAAANRCLARLLEAGDPWGLPWSVAHEFVAVVTQPRIWREPARPTQALQALEVWASAPGARLLTEGPAHLDALGALLEGDDVRGSRVFDARIAATCLAHGIDELWAADRDFTRFPSIRVRNPLL